MKLTPPKVSLNEQNGELKIVNDIHITDENKLAVILAILLLIVAALSMFVAFSAIVLLRQ